MKITMDRNRLYTIYTDIVAGSTNGRKRAIRDLQEILINHPVGEAAPKELSSPQIAAFLSELADILAAYLYNCRKDSDEAQKYGRFLDEMSEKLKEYGE